MKIGIDLGGTNMRIALVGAQGILQKEVIPCPSHEESSVVLDALVALIARNMLPEVKGIGIGVPSGVDMAHGIVYNVVNIPAWKEVHLKNVLEQKFGLPVAINNDSNCFALGEKRFGKGQNCHDLVGITIGTGIGSGLILHDELYSGRNAGAGEIGAFPYLEHDFEHYCSSNYFKTYYGISGKEMAIRASRKDAMALKAWQCFGLHIGELMKTVLYAYDPEMIVIGGGIACAFPFYEETMWHSLQTFLYPHTLDHLKIEVSNNQDIALLGASSLVNV